MLACFTDDMLIHCRTQSEQDALLVLLDDIGYTWGYTKTRLRDAYGAVGSHNFTNNFREGICFDNCVSYGAYRSLISMSSLRKRYPKVLTYPEFLKLVYKELNPRKTDEWL